MKITSQHIKHINRNFKPSWKNDFPWLEYDAERATNIKLYAVKEHTKTQDHTDSCKKNEILNTPPEHIKSLMKIIYCLAKNDIPLNKFSQLAHLGRAIGAPDLVSENHPITYENNTSIRIIVDESTDISTESHLIIYVKYLINGIIKIQFLSLLQIENSDAKFIYNTIINPFVTRNLQHKIFAFTSDGASVIRENGIATQMKQINPYIFTTHYIVHRLALACEAAKKQ
ncbi:5226_t:CDS:2, partial [Cetraspora pellucida]